VQMFHSKAKIYELKCKLKSGLKTGRN
jgi:hypothetical protein